MGRNNGDFYDSFDRSYQRWKDASNPAARVTKKEEDQIEDSFAAADMEREK